MCNDSKICKSCEGLLNFINIKGTIFFFSDSGEFCTECIDDYIIVSGICVSINFTCSGEYHIMINNSTKEPEC